jgi:RNA polymerase sigma-70 factor (ECF subfamily)
LQLAKEGFVEMGLSRQTSLSLLERAGDEDPQAWSRIVMLYAPLVTHWCRRMGVSRQDCDEVMQETFIAVHASLSDFHRQGTGSFRSWVRSITRHKALDYFRRRKQEPPAAGGTLAYQALEHLPHQEGPEEEAAELSGLYRRALELIRAEFEPRTFQAFWRSVIDGQSTDAIAAELKLSPVAVRIAKSRVLARLRMEVGKLID